VIGAGPSGEEEAAERARDGQKQPGGGRGRHAVAAEDEHHGEDRKLGGHQLEDPAVDRTAGRLDREMPRLAPRDQRDDLKRGRYGDDPCGRAGERSRELVVPAREQQHEDGRP
jgi:hypothetical protein